MFNNETPVNRTVWRMSSVLFIRSRRKKLLSCIIMMEIFISIEHIEKDAGKEVLIILVHEN